MFTKVLTLLPCRVVRDDQKSGLAVIVYVGYIALNAVDRVIVDKADHRALDEVELGAAEIGVDRALEGGVVLALLILLAMALIDQCARFAVDFGGAGLVLEVVEPLRGDLVLFGRGHNLLNLLRIGQSGVVDDVDYAHFGSRGDDVVGSDFAVKQFVGNVVRNVGDKGVFAASHKHRAECRDDDRDAHRGDDFFDEICFHNNPSGGKPCLLFKSIIR